MSVSYKVSEYLGVEPKNGDIGLEIEVEGKNLPVEVVGWRATNDPSLRGHSIEYVIKGPCAEGEMRVYMDNLVKSFKENKSVVNKSVRAGVHCHINVQELSFEELISFIGLYLVFENVIMKACGPNRIGNYFCLRAKDTDYHLITMAEAFRTGNFNYINDDVRYSAINFKSLLRFGSIEFRGEATPSIAGMDKIVKWASMLLGLRNFSKRFDANVLYSYMRWESKRSDSTEFIRDFLGEYATEVLMSYPTNEELCKDISSGLETAQEWTNLAIPIKKGPNPFVQRKVESLFGKKVLGEVPNGIVIDEVVADLRDNPLAEANGFQQKVHWVNHVAAGDVNLANFVRQKIKVVKNIGVQPPLNAEF